MGAEIVIHLEDDGPMPAPSPTHNYSPSHSAYTIEGAHDSSTSALLGEAQPDLNASTHLRTAQHVSLDFSSSSPSGSIHDDDSAVPAESVPECASQARPTLCKQESQQEQVRIYNVHSPLSVVTRIMRGRLIGREGGWS